jgi:hypothetical protein
MLGVSALASLEVLSSRLLAINLLEGFGFEPLL